MTSRGRADNLRWHWSWLADGHDMSHNRRQLALIAGILHQLRVSTFYSPAGVMEILLDLNSAQRYLSSAAPASGLRARRQFSCEEEIDVRQTTRPPCKTQISSARYSATGDGADGGHDEIVKAKTANCKPLDPMSFWRATTRDTCAASLPRRAHPTAS